VGIVERVTLKLDIDTDTKSLGKATGQLKAFERAAKSNDRSLKDMGRGLDRTNRRMSSLGRTFRRVGMIATSLLVSLRSSRSLLMLVRWLFLPRLCWAPS